MNGERYSMSFTTGGLFQRESVELAALYLQLNDWDALREKVIADNLLQARTLNTLKRICREITSRLKTLNREELSALALAANRDQVCLLWLALCRRYRFIAEFAIEVMHERHLNLQALTYADFDHFLNKKAEWHPELDEIQPTTRGKLRQVLFKILRETELLNTDNTINGVLASPEIMHILHRTDQQQALYFPGLRYPDHQSASPESR